MSPLEITPILPAHLHNYWPFLEAGLHQIKIECKADWIPEDHYAGIYAGRFEAFLIKREDRLLGFYDAYPTAITFGKPETKYFLYAVYSHLPRDRTSDDLKMMIADRNQTLEFIMHRARELKCSLIETVSPRHFHARFGFEEHARIYRLDLQK